MDGREPAFPSPGDARGLWRPPSARCGLLQTAVQGLQLSDHPSARCGLPQTAVHGLQLSDHSAMQRASTLTVDATLGFLQQRGNAIRLTSTEFPNAVDGSLAPTIS
ncbi:hypothetical protein GQ53DRAFT_741903 [Thozetella sp. PMI_491]|nr:hypothetical protein GQ53DRAFT_741903 [Thozetella sp. PMI_491]